MLKSVVVYTNKGDSIDVNDHLQTPGHKPVKLAKWHDSYEKKNYQEFVDLCDKT